jgi:SNF2 family DNA or RNA helicase
VVRHRRAPACTKIEKALYPFQREVVDRMVERRKLLVAMEMGLGKTICTIAAVERLIAAGEIGGGLVIAPASLKYQWLRQIEAWTDGKANALVIDGTPEEREAQYALVRAGKVEYCIMNYEQVKNDWKLVNGDVTRRIEGLPRDFIVTDEATAFKNFEAQRSQLIKKLMARYRWALSGQPVENRADEAFSIMEWVDHRVLGPADIFESHFVRRDGHGRVTGYKNLRTLHRLLSSAMARKTRAEVADQMPAVVEEQVLVDFDPKGRRLYRAIAADLLAMMDSTRVTGTFDPDAFYAGQGQKGTKEMGEVMSRLTCLRMLCDHPNLLRESAAAYEATHVNMAGVKAGSRYADMLMQSKALDGVIFGPKLMAVYELVKEILEADPKNKVVVFSFFKGSLRLIQEATAGLTQSVMFHGDLSAKEREHSRQVFATNEDVRLFLSSDAGGYGLDLPMANYLISYDLPWSAGKWDQRCARIVRLSSEFPEVTLISVLMKGSIEERQYDVLTMKQRVGLAVVDGVGFDRKTGTLDLDLDSLSDFLRTSAV